MCRLAQVITPNFVGARIRRIIWGALLLQGDKRNLPAGPFPRRPHLTDLTEGGSRAVKGGRLPCRWQGCR